MSDIRKQKANSSEIYNLDASDFIPAACHYTKDTLITKKGELIQTIKINGINSEKISNNIFNLRERVRKSLTEYLNEPHFAFWIHTVRRKTNLDDNLPYKNYFSRQMHKLWTDKNYWDDKYVNTLYISIVHTKIDFKITDFKFLIMSLKKSSLEQYYKEALEKDLRNLNSFTQALLQDLKEFGAELLSVEEENIYQPEGQDTEQEENETYKDIYSSPLFLLSRIIRLHESQVKLPLGDISHVLSTHKYAIGSNKLEVILEGKKKFASILCLKEYQEVTSEELEEIAQLPIEMIATEVFYPVDAKTTLQKYEFNNYILKISGEESLTKVKSLSHINDKYAFHQQISIMIINDNMTQLNTDIKQVSDAFVKLGIVHVQEDINLENIFWSQIPGNFKFLRRITDASISDIASFASVHNSPVGTPNNKWGRAITLLRTAKGTPYFFSFHAAQNRGHTAILGFEKSGKTVLMNFLISESMKLNPTVLHISTTSDSKVFTEVMEGKYLEYGEINVNPFMLGTIKTNKVDLIKFLNILSSNNFPESFIEEIAEYIINLSYEQRNSKHISENFVCANAENNDIWMGFKQIIETSFFSDIHDFNIEKSSLCTVSFSKFLLKDNSKINIVNALSFAFSTELLNEDNTKPKILSVDNLISCFGSVKIMPWLMEELYKVNGILFANIQIKNVINIPKEEWKVFYKMLDTEIIIPSSEFKTNDVTLHLDLDKSELTQLESLKESLRIFIIKHNNISILAELSLGGLTSLLKILSSDTEVIKVSDLLSSNMSNIEAWVEELYEKLS